MRCNNRLINIRMIELFMLLRGMLLHAYLHLFYFSFRCLSPKCFTHSQYDLWFFTVHHFRDQPVLFRHIVLCCDITPLLFPIDFLMECLRKWHMYINEMLEIGNK